MSPGSPGNVAAAGASIHPVDSRVSVNSPDALHLRFLRQVVPAGSVAELRALDVPERGGRWQATWSGYFDSDHVEQLEREARRLSRLGARGVYATLNPVLPDCLCRKANRVAPAKKNEPSTGDHDIVSRRWLFVDLDPERPSGIASTDSQHEAALDAARSLSDLLGSRGWPAPVAVDSGNGAYLLYRVDLPADDGGLVERCLVALSAHVPGGVEADVSVANPARLFRVPGTWNRKGDHTPGRPHRLARVVELPEAIGVVPGDLLEALAAEAGGEGGPEARDGRGGRFGGDGRGGRDGGERRDAWRDRGDGRGHGAAGDRGGPGLLGRPGGHAGTRPWRGTGGGAGRGAGPGPGGGFDLDRWIVAHGLQVEGPVPWKRSGRKWTLRVCPWNPAHADGAAYLAQQPNGAIVAGCLHNGCSGKGWADLRRLLEPERPARRAVLRDDRRDDRPGGGGGAPSPDAEGRSRAPGPAGDVSMTGGASGTAGGSGMADVSSTADGSRTDDVTRAQDVASAGLVIGPPTAPDRDSDGFDEGPADAGDSAVIGPGPDPDELAAAALLRYEPPPLEVLPPVLRNFVREAAAAYGCDTGNVLLPTLSSVSGAVGVSCRIVLTSQWKEYPILWTCIVAPSGSRKSPPLEAAVEPLRRVERSEQALYRAVKDAHETAQLEYESRLGHWKKQKGFRGDPPERPRPPPDPRRIVSDATVEALVPILQDNPRGVLLSRDELGGWLGSFDMYRPSKGADVARWDELFHGRPLVVDRKHGTPRTLRVERAAVSVCGTIQPGTLRRHMVPEILESGLLARVCLAYPPTVLDGSRPREISPSVCAAYEDVVARLAALPLEVDAESVPVPLDVRLSPEADRRWWEWRSEWARERCDLDEESPLAAVASKLEAVAARIALDLHLVDRVAGTASDVTVLGVSALEGGIAIVRWLWREARRIYGHLLDGAELISPRLFRLLRWIERRGAAASIRDVARGGPVAYRKSADLVESDLAELVRMRLGEWLPPRPSTGGRPPGREFRIAPRAAGVGETIAPGLVLATGTAGSPGAAAAASLPGEPSAPEPANGKDASEDASASITVASPAPIVNGGLPSAGAVGPANRHVAIRPGADPGDTGTAATGALGAGSLPHGPADVPPAAESFPERGDAWEPDGPWEAADAWEPAEASDAGTEEPVDARARDDTADAEHVCRASAPGPWLRGVTNPGGNGIRGRLLSPDDGREARSEDTARNRPRPDAAPDAGAADHAPG